MESDFFALAIEALLELLQFFSKKLQSDCRKRDGIVMLMEMP